MRAVLIAAVILAGCYSPHYGDCEVSCASNVCPSGLECLDGMCRVEGMTGACGVVPDAAGSAGPIPIENLAAAQRDALCNWLVRCGSFEDVATCRSAFGNQLQAPDLVGGVAANKVRYDGEKARQCVDAYEQSTCERARSFSNRDIAPVCQEVFAGTLPAQATCFFNEECVSQNCSRPAACQNSLTCCAGSCVGSAAPGRPVIGQICTAQDFCVNSYCATSTPGVCTAYKAAGVLCATNDECMPGLSCLPGLSDPTMKMCRAPGPTLSSCTQTAECATLADTCRANKCQTGGLIGTVCTGGSDQCQLAHTCSGAAQGMCRLLPTVGESCASFPTCRDGYCNGQSMCVEKLANGSPCPGANGSYQCMSGYCDSTTSQCATKPACN